MLPVLFCGIIAFDQLIKFLVVHHMTPGESIPVFAPFFHITFILNAGAAFGMLEHAQMFFIFAGALVLVLFLFFRSHLKKEPRSFFYGTHFMIAGAVGNFIDRIRIGRVIDYLDFHIWPVFNLADMVIVFGIALMIYSMCFDSKEKAHEEA